MVNLLELAHAMAILPKQIVEVGVNRPKLSHLLPFLINGNFTKAILVEAVPARAERLRRYFKKDARIQVLCAAICEINGKVTLYEHSGASFLVQIPVSPAIASGFRPTPQSPKIETEGLTFDRIDNGEIDILAADIEGAEWHVIRCMRSRPQLICLETHSPSGKYKNPFLSEINAWMEKNAYQIIERDHSDTVWFRKEVLP
jgi:FkbM family methyltransferase